MLIISKLYWEKRICLITLLLPTLGLAGLIRKIKGQYVSHTFCKCELFHSSYNQRNLNSRYRREATNNTKSSTVNLTQRFPDSPWNLSATASVNQVSRDSTISATLPNISANMNRIYPFKRKNAIGDERWYEKISMSYSGEFRNSIHTKRANS